MTFDWTVSLGNLLTILGFGGSGVIFVMMMRGDMLVLGQRVNNVEIALKEMAIASREVAKQEGTIRELNERVNMISRRLDEHINKAT